MPPDARQHARACLTPLAADRQTRGARITPDQLDAAAALLVDLWAAAARHHIGPEHRAWTVYLPRTALDTVTAAPPKRRTPPPGPRA